MPYDQALPKIIPIRSRAERNAYDKSRLVHLRRIGRIYRVDYMFEGRRIRHTLKTDDIAIAERYRSELEYKLRAKLHRLPTDMRLDEFIKDYIQYLKGRLAAKTWGTQSQYFRRFLDVNPNLKVSQLNRGHIEAFISSVSGGKPVPKTWNNLRGYFYTMFKWAKNRDYVAENIVEKLERRREVQRSIRYIKTQAELDRLLGLFSGDSLQAMVATYIYAGLRRTEAIWVTWDDIDFNAQLLHVREKTIDGVSWCPKTKRNRAIPISTKLLPYFERQQKENRHPIWVFPSPEGCRWDGDNLTHRFRETVRDAGLPWTFLDLRHTFASHLAMKGVSLYKIARLMGNSAQICELHYAALCSEELREEVEF